MKVVCVSEGNYYSNDVPKIEVGSFYTVLREHEQTVDNRIWIQYELKEIPGYGYGRANFAPVSSIDEREFFRDYQTQKA